MELVEERRREQAQKHELEGSPVGMADTPSAPIPLGHQGEVGGWGVESLLLGGCPTLQGTPAAVLSGPQLQWPLYAPFCLAP